ncbi:MAG: TonB-dependent receptor [Tannerella sp.]|jgi:TonB-linked SusC/RagA family outer membrane protein|nr:TonB-dependent receptor [Tannerella sp.]
MTKQRLLRVFFSKNALITVTMFFACFFTMHAEHLSSDEMQQAQTVSGIVQDQNGEPVAGATIIDKGNPKNGTITGANGEFSIQIAPNGILKISYIGYIAQEVKTGNDKLLKITLYEDMQNLEEVVVVGYGSQKKVNLTGAVASVSGQDITSKSSTDVVNAMMGQIPGLLVTRSSGQPGSEIAGTASIRIRGFTSVNNSQALVLIDGVEGLLHTLNAEDIESISVLKDAASASIYGSRAAAGVILVTTKKGAAEKTKVTYNGSFGLNVPGLTPKRVPPWEDYEWIHQSLYNINPAFVINREAVDMIANPNHNYRVMGTRWEEYYANNWMHLGMKEYTTQHTHSVSVTGGNDKTQYYVSGGFYTKSGILRYGPDNSNRANFRASLNTEINNYLDFNVQATYERTRKKEVAYTSGAAGLLGLLYTKAGYHGLYNPEEDTYYDIDPYSNGSSANPIQIMKEGGEVRNHHHYFTGFAGLRIKNVVKDLTLDLNFSRRAEFEAYEGDYRFIKGHGRNGATRPTDVNNPQRVVKRKANSYQDKLEALLNYDLNIGKHHVHLLGGASYEQYLRDYMSAEARNGISNDFFSFNYYASDEAANSVLSDAIQPWKMASLFGRINYDFAGRYLLEANLRYDGSSRLSPGNRWGLFPSASVGWRISEEAFFERTKKFIDNLKMRASWGTLGNSAALSSDYYPYLDMISRATFWSMPVYYTNALVSKNLKWETITATNVGMDLGALNNRLNFTADYYWKKNDNMLARLKTGNMIGIANLPLENVGVLKIWGWELSLQWRDRIGEVSYHASFHIDDSRNKLVKYTGNNVITEGLVQHLEGYPINTIWGYRTDGLWKSRDEYLAYKEANPGYESIEQDGIISGGDVRYLTQGKADHKVGVGAGSPEDSGDLVKLGTETPRYLYGVNLGVEWKGFDFSTFWQGVGYRKYIVHSQTFGPMVSTGRTPLTIHRDHWREDNQDAYFARLTGNMGFNYHVTDRWLQNGAYLRLKNIQLGYTIPVPKNVMQSLRVYISGVDVWEYTKAFKVFDPEVSNNLNLNYYPFFRTWTLGVNLTF